MAKKGMTVQEKISKVLELQEQGYKQEEIVQIMDSNIGSIRRMMNRNGYKTENKLFIKKDDDNSHTNVISKENTVIPGDDDNSHTSVINDTEIIPTEAAAILSNDDIRINLLNIVKQYDKIQNIIDWFDSRDDNSHTSVIQLDNGLKIDLPEAENKRTTIRVNEKIWNDFNDLADKYKEYDKQSLISMALKEFIDKYDK